MKLNIQSQKELNRIITGFTTSAGLKSIDNRRRPERHQLGMYLSLLKKNKKSGIYPMVIEVLSPKNDPPDFIFRMPNGNTIGLEVTEATNENYRKEERQKTNDLEEGEVYSEGIDGTIYLNNQEAPDVNKSEVYEKNAEAIFNAITRKTKSLERIRIKKCSENHLGIWPNLPLAVWMKSEKSLDIVERHLTEMLKGELFSGFFDRIFILRNPGERQYSFCLEKQKYTYKAIPLRSAFNK